jgi:glycosyltransferase involved in cell wall biosynthesis
MWYEGREHLARQRVATGIVVSTTYREGAIMAIARELNRQGALGTFYCAFESSWLKAQVARLPQALVAASISNRLDRFLIHGVDPSAIRSVSRAADLVFLVWQRFISRGRIEQHLMYWAGRRFDQRVSHALAGQTPSVIFGLPNAAECTFLHADTADTLKVLHLVNSHPDQHNKLLLELAGVGRHHRELLPSRVVRQVCHEIALADVVLVPSKFVEDQLVARGLPARKVVRVPYGVDLIRFHPPQGRRGDGQHLTCLYVGQISHRKGIRFLIQAARQLPSRNIQFLLVGPVESPELLRDLPQNVRWLPTLVHAEVPSQMQRSDMFVLPSIEDAFPLVTLEAMASGLPIIVSDHAGTAELIQNDQNGLVVPAADPLALKRAIERLASDAPLRRRLGAAARSSMETDHSWSVYGARVLSEISARFRA